MASPCILLNLEDQGFHRKRGTVRARRQMRSRWSLVRWSPFDNGPNLGSGENVTYRTGPVWAAKHCPFVQVGGERGQYWAILDNIMHLWWVGTGQGAVCVQSLGGGTGQNQPGGGLIMECTLYSTLMRTN